MLFFERVKEEKQRLLQENAVLKSKLEGAPDGVLQCRKERGFYKWFHRIEAADGRVQSAYLPKSEREKAKQLAVKTYYKQCVEDNENEIAALDAYLKRHSRQAEKAVRLKRHPGFAELLRTRDMEKELEVWKNEPYVKNPYYKEHLTIRASNGELVRSKSEAFILSSLVAADIPVRYECKLQLGDTAYYPDFTIRRPTDGRVILWEHFGLMSEHGYMKTAQEKIRTYIAHGYYPMENLITTFEQEKSSLDFSRVMDIVELLGK